MNEGKGFYRIISALVSIFFVLNLVSTTFLILLSSFGVPRISIFLNLIGFVVSIILYLFLVNVKKTSPYRKKASILLVGLLFLLLPYIYGLFQDSLQLYVYEWEQENCIATGEFSGQVPEYRCSNGDLIYKTDFKEDNRLYGGGKSNAGFPYWLVY